MGRRLKVSFLFLLAAAFLVFAILQILPAGKEKEAAIINQPDTNVATGVEHSYKGLENNNLAQVAFERDPESPKNDDQTPAAFDAERAIGHIKYLSDAVGPRPAGSESEHLAAHYINEKLDELGYSTSIQEFVLPNRLNSCNVVAFLPGRDGKSIIIGAHFDSRGGPGANDNASGVGVLLELARVAINQKDIPHSLYFVFFGAEERVGKNPSDHHYGSRYYVKHMSEEQKSATLAMINVDMVGVGGDFHIRSLKKEPGPLEKEFLELASSLDVKLSYKQSKMDSDFEVFERSGVDSAWLQWRKDPNYHTSKDTFERINQSSLSSTGLLLQNFIIKTRISVAGR